MKFIRLFISVFLSSIYLTSNAQTFTPKDFRKMHLPKPESQEMYQLTNSLQDFFVHLVKGKVVIEKYKNQQRLIYRTHDGRFLAIDHGEFGGGLFYSPDDTTIKQIFVNGEKTIRNEHSFLFGGSTLNSQDNPVNQLIKNTFTIEFGNPRDFFLLHDSLYVMEGLAHMGFSYGEFYKIQATKDSVIVSNVTKFDDAPFALDVYRNKIYLATLQRFYIIDNGQKDLLLNNVFWRMLYPNSVAVKNEKEVYVGLRGGYADLDTRTGKTVFYQFKNLGDMKKSNGLKKSPYF